MRGKVGIRSEKGQRSWGAILAGMLTLFSSAAPARSAVMLDTPLQPGDTLYVRFELQVPLPVPFNTVNPTFYYGSPQANSGISMAIYDDADEPLASVQGSHSGFQSFGVAVYFADAALSGPLPSSGHVPADLSSYLDRTGMVSFTWLGSSDVVISEAFIGFGYLQPSGGGSYVGSVLAVSAVNTPPPPLPEPGAGLLVGVLALAGLRRRRAL